MDSSLETINGYLVDVFNQMMDIEESALAQSLFSDLSIKEMHAIEAIGMYAQHTSTEVANKLNVTVGTLTVMVNNLVKKDYVERLKHPTDRRIVLLGLTSKGRLLYRAHRSFHKRLVKRTIQGLKEDEVEILVKGLKNLHEFLFEITKSNLSEE